MRHDEGGGQQVSATVATAVATMDGWLAQGAVRLGKPTLALGDTLLAAAATAAADLLAGADAGARGAAVLVRGPSSGPCAFPFPADSPLNALALHEGVIRTGEKLLGVARGALRLVHSSV